MKLTGAKILTMEHFNRIKRISEFSLGISQIYTPSSYSHPHTTLMVKFTLPVAAPSDKQVDRRKTSFYYTKINEIKKNKKVGLMVLGCAVEDLT